jgi:Flp pilus assembly protein TadG
MTMINPNNPTLFLLRVLVEGRIQRARRSQGGASAVEWVLISALLIGVALAVGKIIMDKLKAKAGSIDLGS